MHYKSIASTWSTSSHFIIRKSDCYRLYLYQNSRRCECNIDWHLESMKAMRTLECIIDYLKWILESNIRRDPEYDAIRKYNKKKRIASRRKVGIYSTHMADAPNTVWHIYAPRWFFGKLPAHWIRIRSSLIIGIDLFRERIHLRSSIQIPARSLRYPPPRGPIAIDGGTRRTCKKLTQVRQPTGSLDHMSETNDAHVTRWRHGSRGIAVLNADCSPNTLAAFVLVHSIQIMSAEIVDPPFLRKIQRSMTYGVPNVSSNLSLLNLRF